MNDTRKLDIMDDGCISLLEVNGYTFVALFVKDMVLCIWCEEKSKYDVWAVLDCSKNVPLLIDYLEENATLLDLYKSIDKKTAYEMHTDRFELSIKEDADGSELVAPYENSYLQYDGDVEPIISELQSMQQNNSVWYTVHSKPSITLDWSRFANMQAFYEPRYSFTSFFHHEPYTVCYQKDMHELAVNFLEAKRVSGSVHSQSTLEKLTGEVGISQDCKTLQPQKYREPIQREVRRLIEKITHLKPEALSRKNSYSAYSEAIAVPS